MQTQEYKNNWYRLDYKRNPKKYLKYRLKQRNYREHYRLKRRQIIRELFIKSKARPCMDCSKWFNPWQMDFDHRPGEIKKFAVSANGDTSLENIKAEITKCDIVCANCHRNRTHRRLQFRD